MTRYTALKAREKKGSSPWIALQLAADVPYEFIAQIDLSDAAVALGYQLDIPNHGRLFLFLDMAMLMDETVCDEHACLVIHDTSALSDLVPLGIPAKFEEMERWWRTPDPQQLLHYGRMAEHLDAQGQTEAAQSMRDLQAGSEHDAGQKPFVYPAQDIRLVSLIVLPHKSTLEFTADTALAAFAADDETSDCYEILCANDVGPLHPIPTASASPNPG